MFKRRKLLIDTPPVARLSSAKLSIQHRHGFNPYARNFTAVYGVETTYTIKVTARTFGMHFNPTLTQEVPILMPNFFKAANVQFKEKNSS